MYCAVKESSSPSFLCVSFCSCELSMPIMLPCTVMTMRFVGAMMERRSLLSFMVASHSLVIPVIVMMTLSSFSSNDAYTLFCGIL